MVEQILNRLSRSIAQVGQETGQFRKAADMQNRSMFSFVKDISKMFTSQNKTQATINNSLDGIENSTQQTSAKVDQSNDLIRESISIQTNMLSELKTLSKGIGSLLGGANENGSLVNTITTAVLAAAGGVGLGAAAMSDAGQSLMSSFGINTGGGGGSGGGSSPEGTRDTRSSYTQASSSSGQILSVAEMTKLAKEAGFTDEQAVIMGAIGAAESGGKSGAHNPNANTGDNSYGLWQINMLGDMGPERRRQFGIEDNEQLKDPRINAKAAKMVFDQQGFKAWSVYKHGQYREFLGTARKSLENTPVEASEGGDAVAMAKQDIGLSQGGGELQGKGANKEKRGFIIHHTGGRGDVGGVVSTLQQRGLSVHYVIDREGQIHQLLPSGARGSHMKRGQGIGEGLSNANTEGVEIIAKDDTDVLPVQVEAARSLVQQLGYAPEQVFGHGEVNPHKQRTEGMTVVNAIRGNATPVTDREIMMGGMVNGEPAPGGGYGPGSPGNTGLPAIAGIFAPAISMLTQAGTSLMSGMTGITAGNLLSLMGGAGSTQNSTEVNASKDSVELTDNRASLLDQNMIQTKAEFPTIPATTPGQIAMNNQGNEPKTGIGNMALNGAQDRDTLADWYRELIGGKIIPDSNFGKTIA